ncbi:MAG: hypothetical protein Q9227_009425 [Pyrenula ochraceoflavens]
MSRNESSLGLRERGSNGSSQDSVIYMMDRDRPVKKRKIQDDTHNIPGTDRGRGNGVMELAVQTDGVSPSSQRHPPTSRKQAEGLVSTVQELEDVDEMVKIKDSNATSIKHQVSGDRNISDLRSDFLQSPTYTARVSAKSKLKNNLTPFRSSSPLANASVRTSDYFETPLRQSFRDKEGRPRGSNSAVTDSPDDLQKDEVTVPRKKSAPNKKRVQGCKNLEGRGFRLSQVFCSSIPTGCPSTYVTIEPNEQRLAFYIQDAQLDNDHIATRPFNSIAKVLHGNRVVCINGSKAAKEASNKAYMELLSPKETVDFVLMLQNQNIAGIQVEERSDDRLLKEWKILTEKFDKSQTQSRPSLSNSAAEGPSAPLSTPMKNRKAPPKIVSQMQNRQASPPRATVIGPGDRTHALHAVGKETIGSSVSTQDLLESYRKLPPRAAATRSSAVTESILDKESRENRPLAYSKTGALGPKWETPLLYPRIGKKRAEVEFNDLQRLDDDEFLNDNLIGFFLRYLQQHLEDHCPEVARKIYFFNTFFFQTLTNAKGKKGINYEGVLKWTRSDDLLSKDFIIVPINESAHWFLAIIYNLPALERVPEGLADVEVETPTAKAATSPSADGRADDHLTTLDRSELNAASDDATAMEIDQQNEHNSEAFEHLAIATSSPSASKNRARGSSSRKKGIGLKKFSIDQPAVITLDSLKLRRYSTVGTLKDYIIAEAKEKRSIKVERSQIQGVTAEGIPFQGNYSDCGLYLLAYMEKFILDPYKFVEDVLRKEMSGKQWPEMVSTDLRTRLRDLIMCLHKKRTSEDNDCEVPAVGKILLGSAKPQTPTPDFVEIPQPRKSNRLSHSATKSKSRNLLKDPKPLKTNFQANNELEDDPILQTSTSNDETEEPKPQKINLQANIQHHQPVIIDDNPPDVSQREAEVSSEFLKGIQEAARGGSRTGESERSQRGNSVSTDFLNGSQSYQHAMRQNGSGSVKPNSDVGEANEQQGSYSGDASSADSSDELTRAETDVRSMSASAFRTTDGVAEESEPEIPETQSVDDTNEEFHGFDGPSLDSLSVPIGYSQKPDIHKEDVNKHGQREPIEIEDDDDSNSAKEKGGGPGDDMLEDLHQTIERDDEEEDRMIID